MKVNFMLTAEDCLMINLKKFSQYVMDMFKLINSFLFELLIAFTFFPLNYFNKDLLGVLFLALNKFTLLWGKPKKFITIHKL